MNMLKLGFDIAATLFIIHFIRHMMLIETIIFTMIFTYNANHWDNFIRVQYLIKRLIARSRKVSSPPIWVLNVWKMTCGASVAVLRRLARCSLKILSIPLLRLRYDHTTRWLMRYLNGPCSFVTNLSSTLDEVVTGTLHIANSRIYVRVEWCWLRLLTHWNIAAFCLMLDKSGLTMWQNRKPLF